MFLGPNFCISHIWVAHFLLLWNAYLCVIAALIVLSNTNFIDDEFKLAGRRHVKVFTAQRKWFYLSQWRTEGRWASQFALPVNEAMQVPSGLGNRTSRMIVYSTYTHICNVKEGNYLFYTFHIDYKLSRFICIFVLIYFGRLYPFNCGFERSIVLQQEVVVDWTVITTTGFWD
jgi:hypothetical protein